MAGAAQQLLKCDQPNSLRTKPNFLDINPDSFMCDVQISVRLSDSDPGTGIYDSGDDLYLTCEAYGDPEPVVYWSFGQRILEKSLSFEEHKYLIQESRNLLSTNKTSELRVKNLQSLDVGVYVCTAEISGSNNRKQAKYQVKEIKGGLVDARGLVVGGVGILAAATSSLFNRPLSNWTLLLLSAITLFLFIFLLMLLSFICWRCQKNKAKKSDELTKKKEQEKLLSNGFVILQPIHQDSTITETMKTIIPAGII